MLSENIKAIRTEKGLSQSEVADRLHVVRQTVSKWEKGLSVPDAEMLIQLSKVLETPVSTLLDESKIESETDDLKTLAKELELINFTLAQKKAVQRKLIYGALFTLCAVLIVTLIVLAKMNSPYLNWDYSDPETAVVGVMFHGFEWVFVRTAPFVLILLLLAIFLMYRKHPTA